jgi:hypothetical protein
MQRLGKELQQILSPASSEKREEGMDCGEKKQNFFKLMPLLYH